MAIDITTFYKINIVDTCSIWNILSSTKLFAATVGEKCVLSCTQFVLYECLYKPRAVATAQDDELRRRLTRVREDGHFTDYPISIEDLQTVEVLRSRMNLSKGEISSMVFAKKTRQAFLTDDEAARTLARNLLEDRMIQTTPQLFGWLFFLGVLTDTDKDRIIDEHRNLDRPLEKYFNETYYLAMQMKLARQRNCE